ncbi:hypothetical protein [Sphingomonas mesophila]|uniref:hypothetical protein n=1 Tax=Sphingomonas mesophila TaxID=2303576 RepID=UPI0013C2FFBB|nr:hypothetical protein [Sphingomonas mesophila]
MALVAAGLALATISSANAQFYTFCYAYGDRNSDEIQVLTEIVESSTSFGDFDRKQAWFDLVEKNPTARQRVSRNGGTGGDCSTYSKRESAERLHAEKRAKYIYSDLLPVRLANTVAVENRDKVEIVIPRSAGNQDSASGQARPQDVRRTSEEVAVRNARRQADYDAALKARDEQIARSRAAHAAAVQRGAQAVEDYAAAADQHVRELNAVKAEGARRQAEYTAQLQQFRSSTTAQCVPSSIGVAGAWAKDEAAARLNLERMRSSQCGVAPITNIVCRSANFSLPIAGRAKLANEYECSGICMGGLQCEQGAPSAAVRR